MTIEDRKRVIAVATSRLVELHSLYPSTEQKKKLASLLSTVTGLPPSIFFDHVSHRGYIPKYLDNLRSKSPASQKKYTWKKKAQPSSSTGNDNQIPDNTDHMNITDASFDGCARGLVNCGTCGGRFDSFIMNVLF